MQLEGWKYRFLVFSWKSVCFCSCQDKSWLTAPALQSDSGGQWINMTVSPTLCRKSQLWSLQVMCESVGGGGVSTGREEFLFHLWWLNFNRISLKILGNVKELFFFIYCAFRVFCFGGFFCCFLTLLSLLELLQMSLSSPLYPFMFYYD